ncbi:MAG: hypothetical protein HYV19_13235 [Gemmatimonadetes bacterium]|nr:hypothetical protein [Gemmatimonadota bacterium]
MSSSASSDASHDDRLLVVIGVVTGACVALARLASATGVDGTSWLMVLLEVTVAAQGGAALLWVTRAALRWLVGRTTGSHAALDAYRRDDTSTYVVFLLSLATAVGVQLIAAVVWLPFALFAAAQWTVVRRALRARVRPVSVRPIVAVPLNGVQAHAATMRLVMTAMAGAASVLYAVSWLRLIEQELGATAGVATLVMAAVLGGLAVGLLGGSALARALGGRMQAAPIVLLAASGAWGLASATLVPGFAESLVGAAPWLASTVVALMTALPMMAMSASLPLHHAAGIAPRERARRDLSLLGAATFGAAAAACLAADVLFAFDGLRVAVWAGAACNLLASAAALMLTLWTPKLRTTA